MSAFHRARAAVLLTLTTSVVLAGFQPVAALASGTGAVTAAGSAVPTVTTTATTTATPTPAPTTTASYTVSPAVYTFLTSALGIAVGSSATLSGSVSGSTITVATPPPTALKWHLPSDVAAPKFSTAQVVIDTAANTVTVSATSTDASHASLKAVIAHANTSTMSAADLSGAASLTSQVFGVSTALTGSLSYTGGTVVFELGGTTTVAAGASGVQLAKGARISLASTGLSVSGAATVAVGSSAATTVAVSGILGSTTTWTLTAAPASTGVVAVAPGLKVAPSFHGTITNSSGTIRYDLSAPVSAGFAPVAGENVTATTVELGDGTPPTGGPTSLAAGKPWFNVTGDVRLPGGAVGTAHVLTDPAKSSSTVVLAQTGSVALTSTPSRLTLSKLNLSGAVGSQSGSAAVTVDNGKSATVSQAKAWLVGGQLVLGFTADLGSVGLGASGTTATTYWASGAVPAFTEPATGHAVALTAGLSTLASPVKPTPTPKPTATPVPTATSTSEPTAAPTRTPAPTPTPTPAPSVTLSQSVRDFLTKLGVTLGTASSPDGKGTVTITGSAPTKLPFTLPTGDTITFGPTTITLDSQGTLSATASATATNGAGGSLRISVAHAATSTLGADLGASLAITGLPVLGTTVDLTGTLGYSNGSVSASLTGALAQDDTVSPLLTVQAGSAVTLSTEEGLHVEGAAVVGTGNATFTVAVSGTFTDLKNWSLSVSDAAGAPSFTPVTGLTITPNFTGSVTSKAGNISFDVRADEPLSWDAGGSVTLALNRVEISNGDVPDGLSCPSIDGGDIWIDAGGSLNYANAGIQASAEGCVDVTKKTFTITGSETGAFGPSNGFTLSNAKLMVTGDLNAGTVQVSGSAVVTITAVSSQPQFTVGIQFGSDGSFVAATGVDASTLGVPGLSGQLFVATKAVKGFDPTTLQINGVQPFDLSSGVTVTTQYTPSDSVQQALSGLGLGSKTQTQLQANLSTSGFAMKISLNFGAATNGAHIFSTGGASGYLNSLSLGFTASTNGVSFNVSGTGYVTLPALYGGNSSAISITVTGSLDVSPIKLNLAISISGACGADSCPWKDAFGIQGLQVDSLSGSFGLDLTDPATPVPTLSFAVSNLVLPDSWGKAIGVSSGARISAALNLDVTQPELIFSITGSSTDPVALTPLAIASNDPNVVNAIQVNTASLIFAPLGGSDPAGNTIAPGVSLAFDAAIEGVRVHVDGAVSIAPPSFTANIAFGALQLGSLSIQGTTLSITAQPTSFSFTFSGGFTDTYTGIYFSASVALGASTSLAGGTIALTAGGGYGGYVDGGFSLSGGLQATSSGVTFTASGTARLAVAGQQLGALSVTFSPDTGALFAQLGEDAAQVASAFRSLYGYADYQSAYVLDRLKFGATSVAAGLSTAYGEAASAVMEALGNAGYDLNTLVDATRSALGAGAGDIAAAMQYFGYSGQQIASSLQYSFGYTAGQVGAALQSALGYSQAAVYNLEQSINGAAQGVLDSVESFFNTGAYNIDVFLPVGVPLLLDVSGGSQSAGSGVIDYTYNGGYSNQQWYVLSTDSGYAELVNRNSGMCLDAQGTWNGAAVVQNPCTGNPTQQWYTGGGQPSGTHVLTNRASGRVLDVTGKSWSQGTGIEIYDYNAGWNQSWTFVPAIGG